MTDSLVKPYLTRNPWAGVLPDGMLLQSLMTAGLVARDQMGTWSRQGEIEEGRDSFAAVILDPTRPRWAPTILDRIMAIILIGPSAKRYLPNAVAKADAHDRHGVNNGALVDHDIHRLGTGDFAYSNSAEYRRTIGGGSGLSCEQDAELVYGMLATFVEDIIPQIASWINAQRELKPVTGHRWLSPDDTPALVYVIAANLIHEATTVVTTDDAS